MSSNLKQGSHPFKGLPFLVAVAAGEVAHWRVEHRFGRNSAVGVVEEDLWEAGGTMVWPAAKAVVSVVSDDANDTNGGSGAWTACIRGLDENFLEIQETVTLNGLTPVVTNLEFYRVNCFQALTSGVTDNNVGNLTATLSGNTIGFIEIGDGISHQSHYTLPAGMQGFIIDVQTWQGKDATQDVAFWHRHDQDTWHKHYHVLSYRGSSTIQGHLTDGFSGGDDIKMTSVKDGASGADINSAGLYTLLIKEL